MTSRKIALLSMCSVLRDVNNDYVTYAIIEIPELKRNRGLSDVLSPMEGEKSAGNETILHVHGSDAGPTCLNNCI